MTIIYLFDCLNSIETSSKRYVIIYFQANPSVLKVKLEKFHFFLNCLQASVTKSMPTNLDKTKWPKIRSEASLCDVVQVTLSLNILLFKDSYKLSTGALCGSNK